MEPREDDSKTFTQVYISKITRKCQPEHLEKEFEACGKIDNIQMKGNYAFISFEEHEGAVEAIEKMNGKPFQG
jgi:RNA recognition motif-containing protein